MRHVPLECDINIAVNWCSGFATSTQKGPSTAMLISRSRGTCLLTLRFLSKPPSIKYVFTCSEVILQGRWPLVDRNLATSMYRWGSQGWVTNREALVQTLSRFCSAVAKQSQTAKSCNHSQTIAHLVQKLRIWTVDSLVWNNFYLTMMFMHLHC